MYLQNNLFLFRIKELQQILCVLFTEQLLTVLKKLSALAVNICGKADSNKALLMVQKRLITPISATAL